MFVYIVVGDSGFAMTGFQQDEFLGLYRGCPL